MTVRKCWIILEFSQDYNNNVTKYIGNEYEANMRRYQ